MRLALVVTLVALAALGATAEPARACSCGSPGDARGALEAADAALIGTVVERRAGPPSAGSSADPVTLVLHVDERIKGRLSETLELQTVASSASCGIEVPVGTQLGLLLRRSGDRWTAGLCDQIAPAALRQAAKALPAPDGSGAAALLAGGRFSPVSVLALDRQLRTLAYGKGRGTIHALSVCPGSKRVAELGQTRDGFDVGVRELGTLRLLRERVLSPPMFPGALSCADAHGSRLHVFATNGDRPEQARLLTVTRSGIRIRWSGTATQASIVGDRAYLNTGRRGTRLLSFDLRRGLATQVGTLPAYTGALVPDAAGTRLAGVVYGDRSAPSPPWLRLVSVSLQPTSSKVRSVPLGGPNQQGYLFWLSGGRLVFLPTRGETGLVRVYDRSLRLRASFGGWSARSAAVYGSTAYGVDYEGHLLSARLPAGPVRVVRQLPSSAVYALVAVPG